MRRAARLALVKICASTQTSWYAGPTSRVLRPLLFALAMFFVSCVTTEAADTGSVSGAVFDVGGRPTAGATVTISGDRPPVRRSVETGANGTYRFEYLLPGEYSLEFSIFIASVRSLQ